MNARKTSATDARTTKDTRTTPPAGRLAHWLHVLRWPVVIVWILATVFLLPLAAGLPPAAPSTRVALLQDAAAHGRGQPQSEQAIVIFARKGPLSSADLSAVASANRAVRRIAGTVTGMGAVGAPQRSADGRAETFTATVTAPQHSFLSAAAAAVTAIRRAVGPAPARAGDKLVVAVTGDAAVAAGSAITTETVLLVTAVLIVAVKVSARPSADRCG